ncbi:MAG: YhbY family RNA-binding protein [Rectinemataceae bacterium]
MLTSRQRSRLAGIAQTMDDLVQLGKDGASPGFLAQFSRLLEGHELVKLRFIGHKGERADLVRSLAEASSSEVVRLIGHTAIFWKRNPDPKKQKVELE